MKTTIATLMTAIVLFAAMLPGIASATTCRTAGADGDWDAVWDAIWVDGARMGRVTFCPETRYTVDIGSLGGMPKKPNAARLYMDGRETPPYDGERMFNGSLEINGHFNAKLGRTIWTNPSIMGYIKWNSTNIRISSRDHPRIRVCNSAVQTCPNISGSGSGGTSGLQSVPPILYSTGAVTPEVEDVHIVSDPGDDNTYHLKEKILVGVIFNQPVKVNTNKGTPRLRIDMNSGDGGVERASYVRGSGTEELIFEYAVRKRNTSTEGISVIANSLNLGGGRIRHANVPKMMAELAHEGTAHDPNHLVSPIETTKRTVELGNAFVNRHKVSLTFDKDIATLTADQLRALRYAFTVRGADLRQHPKVVEHHATRNDRILLHIGTPANAGQHVSVTYAGSRFPHPLRTSEGVVVSNFDVELKNRTTTGEVNTTVAVADAEVQEGPDAKLVFRVYLNNPVPHDVNAVINYRTENITATNGEDYQGTSGRIDSFGNSMPDYASI